MITDNGLNIHISDYMLEEMRKRGQGTSGSAIKATVIKWQGMINHGELELAEALTPDEIQMAVRMIARQAKADRLTHKEFWGMSAERLAAIVEMHDESLGERMVRLGELAAMAIKERVGGVIVFPPGTGGRPRRQ